MGKNGKCCAHKTLLATNPGILNVAPFVVVPPATLPLTSRATIPIVSWCTSVVAAGLIC